MYNYSEEICVDEDGCYSLGNYGFREKVNKGQWYSVQDLFPEKECHTVCDKYETLPVTRDRDTPVTKESQTRPEKFCVHYNTNEDCVRYETIDVNN